MGLCSKSDAEPLTYPPVDRTVHVPARCDAAVAHLTAYSRLWSPKQAEQCELLLGAVGSWTAIRLPAAVHPWQLHHLAYWILDCPGRDVSWPSSPNRRRAPTIPPIAWFATPRSATRCAGGVAMVRAGPCRPHSTGSCVVSGSRCQRRTRCRRAIRVGERCGRCSRIRDPECTNTTSRTPRAARRSTGQTSSCTDPAVGHRRCDNRPHRPPTAELRLLPPGHRRCDNRPHQPSDHRPLIAEPPPWPSTSDNRQGEPPRPIAGGRPRASMARALVTAPRAFTSAGAHLQLSRSGGGFTPPVGWVGRCCGWCRRGTGS